MSEFTSSEWAAIREKLRADPVRYGLPARTYGSVVLASFNIRKLGSAGRRTTETWKFFGDVCRHFDLLAVQEVLGDTSGLERLVEAMGPEFELIVSDTSGAFPGETGLEERLAFIWNKSLVTRGGIVTDVALDRRKVLMTIARNNDGIHDALADFSASLQTYDAELDEFLAGNLPDKPSIPELKVKMPALLSFVRQPFAVEFTIGGHPGSECYHFLAVNAHLYFGNYIADRRQEFEALTAWIVGKVADSDRAKSRNILLLGDLNLDYDNPSRDRKRIIDHLEALNERLGPDINVYFPFLEPHENTRQLTDDGRLRTNARVNETFDQIGIFTRDPRCPKTGESKSVGLDPRGTDYGVFDFANLFAETLHQRLVRELDPDDVDPFFDRFENEVSDHMPLWLRLKLPDLEPGASI